MHTHHASVVDNVLVYYREVEVPASSGGVPLVVCGQQPHLGVVPEVEGVNVMVLCL